MLNRKEMINLFGINETILRSWKNKGLIKVHAYGNTIQTFLYEMPNKNFHDKIKKINLN